MSPPPVSARAPHARSRTRHGAPASRIPRRVSGPARPRAVAGTTAGTVALPRTLGAPPPFRRWLRRLGALPDHRLLDRLIGGSAWIVVVGTALIGIVFMQVSLLKLNSGIGRSVERATTLDRQNSELRAEVSELGSNDRIQAEAQRLGLVVPPAGSVTFLGAHGERIGGDAPIAMATGTADAPQPAGTGAGVTAAPGATVQPTQTITPSPQGAQTATTAAQSAPTTSTPTPTQPAQPQPQQASTSPPAGGTAAGGATPVAPATAQQP
jgi:cell division protein FtsL